MTARNTDLPFPQQRENASMPVEGAHSSADPDFALLTLLRSSDVPGARRLLPEQLTSRSTFIPLASWLGFCRGAGRR